MDGQQSCHLNFLEFEAMQSIRRKRENNNFTNRHTHVFGRYIFANGLHQRDGVSNRRQMGQTKTDDLAMADRSFPKAQYKPVLAKANKAIDLFMQANPEFKGIEASAKRVIRGDSYLPNGALPLELIFFTPVISASQTILSKWKCAGKLSSLAVMGLSTVYFNSLRDVLESVQAGSPFSTVNGEEIFDYKKQLGDFKGFRTIEPMVRRDEKHEAIIITPDNCLINRHPLKIFPSSP